MTFPIGALIGLFAANCVIAYRVRRVIAGRDLHRRAVHRFIDQQLVWPLESDGIDIPLDGPPMIIIPMQQLYDEIHLALREDELEDHE